MNISKVPMFDLSRKIKKHDNELNRAFKRVLDSGSVILGENVKSFEVNFAEYLGSKYCISVANGTDAIEIAIKALKLPRGTKIATVANAGGYSSTAIISAGFTPKYIDVDMKTGLVSLDILKNLDLSDVSAVVLTHLFGNAVGEIEEIISFLHRNSIRVIEDCAQAHGAKVKNKYVGTFADVSAFSFYPTKNLGALGDGGAIITSDGDIYEMARSLRTYGWKDKYEVLLPYGQNSRLDELQAAFLLIFLNSLDKDNEIRREIGARYKKATDMGVISTFEVDPNVTQVNHLFVIKTLHRTELIEHLNKQGISHAIHYPYLDSEQTGFVATNQNLKNSEALKYEILSIPVFPELNEMEIQIVVDALKSFAPALL
jgi:dTDP-4-amino-4,6-dideoxygalactose transaminase